jgi:hypothetical protein
MREEVFVVLGLWGFFAGVSWVIWVIATNIRMVKLGRAQAEMQANLLERLGSSQEMLSFLQTETGRRLLESPPVMEPRKNPMERILTSVQAGILLAAVGGAFLGTSGAFFGTRAIFLVLGFVGIALGAGFLASAAVTYMLSKNWGLLEERDRREAA